MWFHLDLMFLETSALSSENVSESFLQCARIILSKISSGLDRCRLLRGVLIGSPLFLGSIDPYRMYSGIQCNRLLAAEPDRSLTQERPQKSSRSCALCQTWLHTDLYDSSSVRLFFFAVASFWNSERTFLAVEKIPWRILFAFSLVALLATILFCSSTLMKLPSLINWKDRFYRRWYRSEISIKTVKRDGNERRDPAQKQHLTDVRCFPRRMAQSRSFLRRRALKRQLME